MANEMVIPDVEVVVRAGSFDTAIIAFFRREDIHQGYEVVCGVGSQNEVASVCALLQDAITALRSSSWHSVDELDAFEDAPMDEPPF